MNIFSLGDIFNQDLNIFPTLKKSNLYVSTENSENSILSIKKQLPIIKSVDDLITVLDLIPKRVKLDYFYSCRSIEHLPKVDILIGMPYFFYYREIEKLFIIVPDYKKVIQKIRSLNDLVFWKFELFGGDSPLDKHNIVTTKESIIDVFTKEKYYKLINSEYVTIDHKDVYVKLIFNINKERR